MKLRIEAASSILDYSRIAFEIQKDWKLRIGEPEIWYRGVGDVKYKLLPGAYRSSNFNNWDEWTRCNDYKSFAVSYLDFHPSDEWDWYYVMQHYGLPTRLLDWTESQLIAAYFAADAWQEDRNSVPCVWMIDAASVNKESYGVWELPFPQGDFTKHWLPNASWNDARVRTFEYNGVVYDNQNPIAITPRRTSPRIVGQQGMFTIHGKTQKPIEDLFAFTESAEMIVKIEFKGVSRTDLLEELRVLGISKSLLFPELPSIADDLKNRYIFANALASAGTQQKESEMAKKKIRKKAKRKVATKKAAKRKASKKKAVKKKAPKRKKKAPKRKKKAAKKKAVKKKAAKKKKKKAPKPVKARRKSG